jgi:hypothetical protein
MFPHAFIVIIAIRRKKEQVNNFNGSNVLTVQQPTWLSQNMYPEYVPRICTRYPTPCAVRGECTKQSEQREAERKDELLGDVSIKFP